MRKNIFCQLASYLFRLAIITILLISCTNLFLNAQGLITHDFNDGNMGPFVECTTQNPNYAKIVNNRLRTYWEESSYNSSNRMTKGAEACGDPAYNGIGYLTHKYCWMGFTINIDENYMGSSYTGIGGLAQIFGFNDAAGQFSWTSMLDIEDGNLTWIDRRGIGAARADVIVYQNFPRGEDVDIIIHSVLSDNNQGIVEIYVNGQLEYSAYNIRIGMGEFDENDWQTNQSYTEFKIGQYNHSGAANNEIRIVDYDNVSWYDGVDGYDIVDPNSVNTNPITCEDIQGVVFEDANENGCDPSAAGVAGVTVQLFDCNSVSSIPVAVTMTAGDGSYTFGPNEIGDAIACLEAGGSYNVVISGLPAGYINTTNSGTGCAQDNDDSPMNDGVSDCVDPSDTGSGIGETAPDDDNSVDFGIVPAPILCDNVLIQENESGFCSVDGSINNNNDGYTGSGFANTENVLGNSINWQIDGHAGEYSFEWRFANGGSAMRPANLRINGVTVVNDIVFHQTGAWTNWDVAATITTVTLGAGIKTVKLQATGNEGLSNIDYMEVTGPGVISSPCGSTASQANKVVHIRKRNAVDYALDAGNPDNSILQLWSQNPNNLNQQWIEIDRGFGYYSYQKSGTNLCIDGGDGGSTNQAVGLNTCHCSNLNQHWQKESVDGDFLN